MYREILDLKERGLTHREIAEKIGLDYKQVKTYVFCQYTNQRKTAWYSTKGKRLIF